MNFRDLNTNQNNKKENAIKDIALEFESLLELPEPINSYIETIESISLKILKKYSSVLEDLSGCMIYNNYGELEVTLAFEKKGNGNVIDLFQNKETTESRIMAFNNRIMSNKIYDLSDEVKGIFQRFLNGYVPNQDVNWKNYISEVTDQNQYGGKKTIVLLNRISLNKLLLELMYGNKERRKYQIRTLLNNYTNPNATIQKDKFLTIQILSDNTVKRISKLSGHNSYNMGISLITLDE